MVRQWQDLFYDARYSSTTLDGKATDFMKLAEAYHANGYNVTKPEEFDVALKDAIASNKPCIINCEIGRDEKVFPMIPAGKGYDNMITFDDYNEN